MSVRRDLQAHLAGRITTTRRPLRHRSVCQLCGLDSGPWLTLQAARQQIDALRGEVSDADADIALMQDFLAQASRGIVR